MIKPEKSFLFLLLLVVLFVLGGWFVILAPYQKAQTLFKNLPTWVNSGVQTYFPADLTIKITNGVLSTNQKGAYCLILPNNDSSAPKSGVIIDPAAKPDLTALGASSPYKSLCQPLALVGSTFFLYPDQNNSYKIEQIPSDITFTIDQPTLSKYVDQYAPLAVNYGQKFYIIAPFLLMPLIYAGILLNNFWYALIVKFVLKRAKFAPLTFGQSYRISLFFYNFLILLDLFLVWSINYFFKINLSLAFPFRNTILIAAASYYYYRSRQPVIPVTPPVTPPSPPVIPSSPPIA